jgi:DNA repair protein RecN (Recombination protein N)
MLSIKAQTAKHDDISTFIFDEIDAGISGNTAKVVAEKFAKISKNAQIIAISHLPQISSMANNNLLIVKTEDVDKTTTMVKKLTEEEKVLEIIRLIGGSNDSESAVLHAKELISNANEYKRNI